MSAHFPGSLGAGSPAGAPGSSGSEGGGSSTGGPPGTSGGVSTGRSFPTMRNAPASRPGCEVFTTSTRSNVRTVGAASAPRRIDRCKPVNSSFTLPWSRRAWRLATLRRSSDADRACPAMCRATFVQSRGTAWCDPALRGRIVGCRVEKPISPRDVVGLAPADSDQRRPRHDVAERHTLRARLLLFRGVSRRTPASARKEG